MVPTNVDASIVQICVRVDVPVGDVPIWANLLLIINDDLRTIMKRVLLIQSSVAHGKGKRTVGQGRKVIRTMRR